MALLSNPLYWSHAHQENGEVVGREYEEVRQAVSDSNRFDPDVLVLHAERVADSILDTCGFGHSLMSYCERQDKHVDVLLAFIDA